jgi:hypothetical protein
MLRVASLSLLVIISIALVLPMAGSKARHSHGPAYRHHRRHRHHSRAWWKRHHARLRHVREARSHKSQPLAKEGGAGESYYASAPAAGSSTSKVSTGTVQWRLAAPQGRSAWPSVAGGVTKFYAYAPGGKPGGQATLSVIPGGSGARMFGRERRQMLGGVRFADLRRTVIDRMIATGGWVLNDVEQQIGGRRVYVVTAQTPASNDGRVPEQSWVFYFTESEGLIYSLATNTSTEFSERMNAESERLLASVGSPEESARH